MAERFTILGGSGYIGRNVTSALQHAGADVVSLRAGELPDEPGHVIFCIGVASDFRTRPYDTMRAHVCALEPVLAHGRWDSFTYLSSTRVYAGAEQTTEEATLRARPSDPDQLYNISKLAGESLCLSAPFATARVVRLSNVYGDDARSGTFIADVAEQAHAGIVTIGLGGQSEKDYVALDDVCTMLPAIARAGRERLYNLASGRNTSVDEIAATLRGTGVDVRVAADGPVVRFPAISIERIQREFNFMPRQLLAELDKYVATLGVARA